VMRCTARKVLRTAEQEPVVLAAAANFAGAVRQPEHRVIAGALNNRGRFE
jgi:hypothetical protein